MDLFLDFRPTDPNQDMENFVGIAQKDYYYLSCNFTLQPAKNKQTSAWEERLSPCCPPVDSKGDIRAIRSWG